MKKSTKKRKINPKIRPKSAQPLKPTTGKDTYNRKTSENNSGKKYDFLVI